jgi:hypothetical protein
MGDFTRPLIGESGRARLDDDAYPTPALNSAALVLGLRKMGLKPPPLVLDPCGGAGQLARVVMALAPGVDVQLSDFSPRREAADLYTTLASVDATIPADLESMLRVTGARAIFSNPPFKKSLYAAILHNCRDFLTRGDIELLALMQRAQRGRLRDRLSRDGARALVPRPGRLPVAIVALAAGARPSQPERQLLLARLHVYAAGPRPLRRLRRHPLRS